MCNRTYNNDFACNTHQKSWSIKTFLASVVSELHQENATVETPLLSMTATASQCSATALVAKLCRIINIFANTFDDDNHFLSAAVNFTNLLPGTINDVLNWNWLTYGLDLSIDESNQCLSAIDFLSPLENPEDLKDRRIMSSSVTVATRELEIGQDMQ